MSWLGILLIIIGGYLAFKVVGCALKVVMWGIVLVGAYWLLSPWLGLPVPF